eukprot:COSAG02_NODE_5184_length_4560_cov_35.274602_6_plen_108_part_00
MSLATEDYEEGAKVHSNPVLSGEDGSGEASADCQDHTHVIGRIGYNFYEILCVTCVLYRNCPPANFHELIWVCHVYRLPDMGSPIANVVYHFPPIMKSAARHACACA